MTETTVNSQEALERIRRGVQQFQRDIFPAQREMFAALATGQQPLALFISCADSRIVPNLITQTGPGELFAERNPGNLVPHHEEFVGGVSSSIEYAMLALKVPLVIVCGHTDCGVMKALLHPERAEHLPAVRSWMRHAQGARERLLREASAASEEEQLRLLTQYNVELQIENLKTHPSVRSRIEAGDVEIVGWVYNIASGSGWVLNRTSQRFEPIATQPTS